MTITMGNKLYRMAFNQMMASLLVPIIHPSGTMQSDHLPSEDREAPAELRNGRSQTNQNHKKLLQDKLFPPKIRVLAVNGKTTSNER